MESPQLQIEIYAESSVRLHLTCTGCGDSITRSLSKFDGSILTRMVADGWINGVSTFDDYCTFKMRDGKWWCEECLHLVFLSDEELLWLLLSGEYRAALYSDIAEHESHDFACTEAAAGYQRFGELARLVLDNEKRIVDFVLGLETQREGGTDGEEERRDSDRTEEHRDLQQTEEKQEESR